MLHPAVFSASEEAESVPWFTVSGPHSTKTPDTAGLCLCAQHIQTKQRWCTTILQHLMNNTYTSISAPQESTRSPASPPGRTLCHCTLPPRHCMESLCPLGQKVSCVIRDPAPQHTARAERCPCLCRGLRAGLSWGSPYTRRASLWAWGCLAPASHAMHAHYFRGYKWNLF